MRFLEEKRRALMSSNWWVAPSCIAAYRFIGASSRDDSLRDWTGHGHTLTYNNTQWSASGGWNINGSSDWLNNTSLNGKAIKTIIIRYSNLSRQSGNTTFFASPGGSNNDAWLCAQYAFNYYANGEWLGDNSTYPAFVTSFKGLETSPITARRASSTLPTSGVFGGASNALYLGGSVLSSSNRSRSFEALSNQNISHDKHTIWAGSHGSFRALAAAFYSDTLTAILHQLVYQNMMQF